MIVETIMAKAIKKKTRLSGIMDNSSMGISLGQAEMQVSLETARKLRKLMRADARFVGSHADEYLKGNIEYLFTIDDNVIKYEFKQQGKNVFLNVSGNPTKLMAGSNSVPVLLKDGEYDGNAVVNTFKYANRIMFAVLEMIPGFNFKWPAKRERVQITNGDFNVSRLQYAWYTGDLLDSRNEVFKYLRMCYGGLNATKEEVSNLAKDIGLNFTAFDNHEGNFVINSVAGDKKEFSVTLYAKDEEEQGSKQQDRKRFQRLIRFDCSFNDYFLKSNNIKLVKDLEKKYVEICSEGGYDIGFVKWLASAVHGRLKMNYIVGLTLDRYREMLLACEDFLESKKSKRKNAYLILKHWYDFGAPFKTITEKCEALGVNQNNYARDVAEIRKATGIDIEVSRRFHEGMLWQRINGHLTNEERTASLFEHLDNQRIKLAELKERDSKSSENVQKLLSVEGLLKIRKLKPVILESNDFWAYKKLRGE